MAEKMRLRGPDGEGYLIRDTVGLVHTRLAIRDLSDRGRCPMPNEDGDIQAVFNGEIYNWRELRDELKACGHRFESSCDSEILPHGYEEWGDGLFARLRGMFAIGIWDARKQRLVLARDRVGEKPLFYAQRNGEFLFASTIGAIIAALPETPPINPDAMVCYLAHGFIPATHTAFGGIHVFPPASLGVVEDGTIDLARYWALPDVELQKTNLGSAERRLESLLNDCVERCLDADVPVGVFLSGGVDSSLVAALATRQQPGLHCFSIGFEETENNELPYARRVAKTLRLQHHDSILRAGDVIDLLPDLVRAYDQPFGDPSAVPTYAVSRLARQTVKVCLSGDGGDESFAGYWRAQSLVYASRYSQLVPRKVRAWLAGGALDSLGNAGTRLASLNKLSLNQEVAGFTNSQSWHEHLDAVLGPALQRTPRHDYVACRVGTARSFRHATVLQRALFDDFQVQLPDAYLRKVDVASMAASLEVRAPLLDAELLEFAWCLPDRAKLHWGTRKYLLKRIAARLVPPEVIYRRKMGFAMPLTRWFRGELGDFLHELLSDSVAVDAGLLNGRIIGDQLSEQKKQTRDHHVRLWSALWLELWLRSFKADVPTAEQSYSAKGVACAF